MSFYNSYNLFIFAVLFPVYLLPPALSKPLPDSPFDKFIHSLIANECIMPKELKLPFPELSDPSDFSYLSAPLSECQTSDASKDYDEANMLCTEIFDVLKNITCVKYNQSLSSIESNHLSENVCHDFESLKGMLPLKDSYLSGRLLDEVLCKVLCSSEKYEQLCKTLFWSYDTLMKIKQTLSSEEQVQRNGNEGIDKVSSDKVSSSVKPSSTSIISEPASQYMKESEKPKVFEGVNLEDKTNLNQIAPESQSNASDGIGEVTLQNISSKIDSTNPQVQDEVINKTTSPMKNVASTILQNKSEAENEKLAPDVSKANVKPIESKELSNLNLPSEPIDDNKNKIDVDGKFPQKEIKNDISQADLNKNSLTSNVSGIKENQIIKNATTDNLSTNGNNIDSKQVNEDNKDGSKPSENSAELVVPATENDNELKTGNFPDEEDDKLKVKQTNSENQEGKQVEKPKETDYEGPSDILPDNDSKLPEPSTQSTLHDEDIEHQEDKDQYNEIENEGDYSKSEYGESSFNGLSKSKETEVKSSIAVSSSQMTNGYGSSLNRKDNIGRISEEIAMIGSPFPEQEDSHFFFYFLSIVLIIMAGYLIFHNKQKIIALIVEGRHERRRRSGVGYKKLETK